MQHIKVFAVDDVFRRDIEGAATIAAKTVSLLVTPAQGELVMLATELGSVRLAMRSANDEEDAETSPKSFSDLGVSQPGPGGKSDGQPTNPLAALVGPPKQSEPQASAPPAVDTTPDAGQTPTLAPPAPTAAEEPAKATFKMLILEGDVRREVEFEDGVPVNDSGTGNVSVSSPSGSNPPPVADEPKDPVGP